MLICFGVLFWSCIVVAEVVVEVEAAVAVAAVEEAGKQDIGALWQC